MVVMEAGSPPVTLVPVLLERVHGLIALCQDVPVHQYKCKLLAEHMKGLLPFLQEMKTSQTRISAMATYTFTGLMSALERAEILVEKFNHTSKLKRVFLHAQFARELSSATGDILGWLNGLPMVQFKISDQKEEEIKKLKFKLEKLGEELKLTGPNNDDPDFAAEVTEVLRAHTSGEATTSLGGGRVMEDLLEWLAERLDSDVGTVRREWQELKDETFILKEQIEDTIETKHRMEDEFLRQVMVYMDKGIEQEEQATEPQVDASALDRSPPEEFLCPICLQLMEDPTVCESGHTFCRNCIRGWFELQGKGTCPVTRTRVPSVLYDNIPLKSLIIRWKDARPQRGNIDEVSVDTTLRPHLERSSGARDPAPIDTSTVSIRGLGSRSVSFPRSRTCSVDSLLSSLQSNRSTSEIRSSLKQLASIAEHPSGQKEIQLAEGIPAVARLLLSDNPGIVERAASVLDAMTFEVKGENCERLCYEDREVIWTSVTDEALDSLLKLMHVGSPLTRVKAAQTVVNLLADDEIRGEVSRREGVVKGLFGLTNIASGVLFTSEGKSLCIKGLALLGGEKLPYRSSLDSDLALTTALIRLAGSLTATPKLVEETLAALSSLVGMAGPGVCGSLLQRNDIIFLIRLYRSPKSPSARRGHSSLQASLLTEVGKKEVVNILDDLSLAEGSPQVLVECGLITYLLPRITDSEASIGFVRQGIRVLWRCISSSREKFSPVFFQIDFQMEMKGVVRLLARDQIPADAKVDMLSTLIHLCKGRDVDALRESFLNTGGVAALEVLAKSPIVAIRQEVALMVRLVAEFHPCRKELRSDEGTMLLMKLLADDRPSCRCQAVVAVASLVKADDWNTLIDVVRLEQLVDLLQPTYPSECREAATSLLSKAFLKLSGTLRNSDLNVLREKTTIQLLVNTVRDNEVADAKLKAAELLINLAVQDHTICPFLVGDGGGLYVLTKFGVEVGGDFLDKVVQLLDAFCQVSDDTRNCLMEVGGVSLLLDALEKGRNTDETSVTSVASIASIALRSLVTYWPGREAAIEAGVVEKAIECISRRICSVQLMEIIRVILDRKITAERIRKAKGVQALVRILTLPVADVLEKRLAASILAKLIKLDQEAQLILRQENGMSSLNDLLTLQARETNPSSYFSGRMEALEALSAATDEQDNVLLLLREQCIEPLLSILSRESLYPEDEELVLHLFLKLSRGALSSASTVNLMVGPLSRQVIRVIHTTSTSTDSAVEAAICIIRNISLFGPTDREVMLNEGEGVVKLLLDRISRSDDAHEPTNVVHHTVIALERFMLEDKGRVTFIGAGGIPLLVKLLYRNAPGQAKSFALRILVMLASCEHTPKDICTAIWECKSELLPGLGDILELGPRSDCKSQAAILLKYLILYGPRADVCRSVSESSCIYKLMDLRADPQCAEYATEALEAFNKYNRNSYRRYRLPRFS